MTRDAQSTTRPVVLLVGHWGIPTGFRRVLESLVPHLARRFELHLLAVNEFDGAAATQTLPVTVHRNPNPGDLHDPAALSEIMARVRPALVMVLDEPWACARLAPAWRAWPGVRSILYLAVHGRGALEPAVLRGLAAADRLVAFTAGAARLLDGAMAEAGLPERVNAVPHGVDTSVFRPLATREGEPDIPASRRVARQRLFASQPELADAFIVLNANRNQPFKRIDLCLEGFAKFARGKGNDVFLYLHMGSRAPAPGEATLVDRLGIRARVLPAVAPREHPSIPDEELNAIYNACDVGINTSVREGWGLVSFEHAAAGGAQMVPNHSACAELWAGRAILLDVEPPEADIPMGEWCLNEGDVRPESVAAGLEALYADAELRTRMTQLAFENATRAEYRWKTIGERWCALFEEELARSPVSESRRGAPVDLVD